MSAAIDTRARGTERSFAAMLGLVGHQFVFEFRSFQRNRQARFFTVILPVLFLVIFVGVFGNSTVRLPSGTTVKTSTYYVPGLTAMGIISASFANLVVSIVSQRENGILKRRRAAPIPAWVLILGRALVAVVTALFMCVLLLAIGRIFFGVSLPTHTIPAVAAAAVLGALAFCSVAYAAASFIGPVDSAQPIVQATLLPLYFISGVFVPQSQIPSWLSTIAGIFPVRHLTNALVTAYDPGTTGSGINGTDLAVLAAWAVGGLLVALPRFSWMPRGR
jgi:ABC-2 type transport system permease protein